MKVETTSPLLKKGWERCLLSMVFTPDRWQLWKVHMRFVLARGCDRISWALLLSTIGESLFKTKTIDVNWTIWIQNGERNFSHLTTSITTNQLPTIQNAPFSSLLSFSRSSFIFCRGHQTLYIGLLVTWSVGPSDRLPVRRKYFRLFLSIGKSSNSNVSRVRSTAPAQLSATVALWCACFFVTCM